MLGDEDEGCPPETTPAERVDENITQAKDFATLSDPFWTEFQTWPGWKKYWKKFGMLILK